MIAISETFLRIEVCSVMNTRKGAESLAFKSTSILIHQVTVLVRYISEDTCTTATILSFLRNTIQQPADSASDQCSHAPIAHPNASDLRLES